MSSTGLSFDDGAAYEDYMGVWSRLAGQEFLDWLSPAPGLRWADIGCGNGCSTEQLCQLALPSAVDALDPSAEQLAHARTLLADRPLAFHRGDAMALPFADREFDAAVMALVIFFVPDPGRGLAEMVRVTRPGGTVAAYAWDILAGGQPWGAVGRAREAIGLPVIRPPSVGISDIEQLGALWRTAGLEGVETRRINVQRRFADFDTYWTTALRTPTRATLPAEHLGTLREQTRLVLDCTETEPLVVTGFASAVKGRVPA